MPERTIDTALVGGGLSSPVWMHAINEAGQAALIVIGIIVGLLRIEAMLRARRRPVTTPSESEP